MAMQDNSLNRNGHLPTVAASFLHFDLSFMLWVMIGALGIFIARDLHLEPAQKGLLVAIPILSGSLMRLPAGLLADRFGAKRVALAMLVLYFLPLGLGWCVASSLPRLLCVGFLLGIAGASFAVALPLASRWYPPERQGLVMGIAAAGNSGTVIANLFAPKLAASVGWHNVFGLAMLPLVVISAAFLFLARESGNIPSRTSKQPLLEILKISDLWWFCLFYSVTFGGYVGLSSFLPILFRDEYQLSAIHAGHLTALAAVLGSCVRPLGGYLADKAGGVRMLSVLLAGAGVMYMLIAISSTLPVTAGLFMVCMLCLGMGNGAVFQLVPQRFADEIGIATGAVGAIGGLGGFVLPMLLGTVKQFTGSYKAGFISLAIFAMASTVLLRVLVLVRGGWRLSWRFSSQDEAVRDSI